MFWANSQQFMLNEERLPTDIAGVPPDYFSKTGQLWGNPVYKWENMVSDGFSWWHSRIQASAQLFDVIRIDHFRGLESYWCVPADSKDAVNGKWSPGPCYNFIDMLTEKFPEVLFIAEDLGIITEEVTLLREYANIPGMAVLCFAFDPDKESEYLPHNLKRNCVFYTGTHDNDTLRGWLNSAQEREREFALQYCGCEEDSMHSLIRCAMASPANVFIAQMQDWLSLGSEARMNFPGTCGGNWRWRLLPNELTMSCKLNFIHLRRLFFG